MPQTSTRKDRNTKFTHQILITMSEIREQLDMLPVQTSAPGIDLHSGR